MKLSLRDFAVGKKKQREEQKEREKEGQVQVQRKEQDKEKVVAGSESPRVPMTSPLLEPDLPAIEVPSPNPVGLGIMNGDPDGDVKMVEASAGKDRDFEARVTIVEEAKQPGEQEQPPARAVNSVHDACTSDAVDKMWPIEEPPPPPMSPVLKQARLRRSRAEWPRNILFDGTIADARYVLLRSEEDYGVDAGRQVALLSQSRLQSEAT